MTSKTLASIDPAIENRRIVWTCIFEAAGSKAELSLSFNYRFHIVTSCNSTEITDVIFSQCLQRDSSDKQTGCVPFEKFCESNNFVIM